jgi:deoxycytidine triphosphate deaminase
MTLLAGHRLNHKSQYFSSGEPVQCGSSYDLTIGQIIDKEGKDTPGPFTLKPGQMVQVVTQQVFKLPKTVTGHVTCKTSLTKEGIWALTVGIIDPGWDAPIATTLLNFGKVDHPVQVGDSFLRVSFFEHDPIEEKYARRKPLEVGGYIRSLRRQAVKYFPTTFLNAEEISQIAGDKAAQNMRKSALFWLPLLAFLFAVLQIFIAFAPSWTPGWAGASLVQVHEVEIELQKLQTKIELLEAKIDN